MTDFADLTLAAPPEHIGVYVHVPYCRSKCPYCDFNVYVSKDPPWASLAAAMQREIATRAAVFDALPVGSVYFGGGTPSLAPAEWLRGMIAAVQRHFVLDPEPEITLEVEPRTIDAAGLAAARRVGVNRVSIGWQSTHDSQLRVLGRGHNAADSSTAFAAARRVGFDNVSVDLIFAVPGQTLETLERDLDAVEAMAPEHVSLYALTYHPGTVMHRRREAGRLVAVSDDDEAAMMERIITRLEAAGYEHYEVSNFARPGRRAVHNSLYWTSKQYLGVGPGAHSFVHSGWQRGWRWEGRREPEAYMAAWRAGAEGPAGVPQPGEASVEAVESLTPHQLFAERMMCGLRLRDGVNVELAAGGTFRDQAEAAARVAVQRGWAERVGPQLLPTDLGLRFADGMAELFF